MKRREAGMWLQLLLMTELVVQISDIPGISLHNAISDVVLFHIYFVFVCHRKDISPFVWAVGQASTALPGKDQDCLPVSIHPHGRDLRLKRVQLTLKFLELLSVHLSSDPGKDGVPGAESHRADLDKGKKQDESRES